jgi:hypothetical protein
VACVKGVADDAGDEDDDCVVVSVSRKIRQ